MKHIIQVCKCKYVINKKNSSYPGVFPCITHLLIYVCLKVENEMKVEIHLKKIV